MNVSLRLHAGTNYIIDRARHMDLPVIGRSGIEDRSEKDSPECWHMPKVRRTHQRNARQSWMRPVASERTVEIPPQDRRRGRP